MQYTLIGNLLNARKRCYFLSPHLDDAMLSAGWLITSLAAQCPVTVVTAFTQASAPPYTLSAKQFLKQCRATSAQALFADRQAEDQFAVLSAGASSLHLGFADALFRTKPNTKLPTWLIRLLPELGAVYKTYRFSIAKGKIAKSDEQLIEQLATRLYEIVQAPDQASIFVPLGIGNHVDHKIIRLAAEKAFGKQLIYWEDYPYSLNHPMLPVPSDYHKYTLQPKAVEKIRLLANYTSQMPALFPNGITIEDEQFYVPNNLFVTAPAA